MERVRRVELPTLCLATMESVSGGDKNPYFLKAATPVNLPFSLYYSLPKSAESAPLSL